MSEKGNEARDLPCHDHDRAGRWVSLEKEGKPELVQSLSMGRGLGALSLCAFESLKDLRLPCYLIAICANHIIRNV